jgi:hypothetical protein
MVDYLRLISPSNSVPRLPLLPGGSEDIVARRTVFRPANGSNLTFPGFPAQVVRATLLDQESHLDSPFALSPLP